MFFDKSAQIIDGSAGEPVPDDGVTFACAIWEEVGGEETPRGERYDATGEIEEAAAPYLVREANRKLLVDGVTYTVVSAIKHDFVPHVEVLLAELRPAG
jgi:hypothetical protein